MSISPPTSIRPAPVSGNCPGSGEASRASGRGSIRPDGHLFVIASGAKQSIAQQQERMDCFVADAPRNDEVRYRRNRKTENIEETACCLQARRSSWSEVHPGSGLRPPN